MTELVLAPETCMVCTHRGSADGRVRVSSNVRKFAAESFEVWRCARCRSVHATDDVDLDHYYAAYPVHEVPLDWRTRPMYANQRRRLMRAGLRREDSVLDYGCGAGSFLKYLARAKHPDVAGFDAYTESYRDRAVLNRRYDCVVTQDVIEHVPNPMELLDELHELVRPGGLIAVGTPNAAGIDLAAPKTYIHALHQPYHRHILSRQALQHEGEARGWTVVKHYSTMYVNTRLPFINSRFIGLLMRAGDNTLDATLEPPSGWLIAMLPFTLLVGLFGSWFPTKSEMMTIFRRPE